MAVTTRSKSSKRSSASSAAKGKKRSRPAGRSIPRTRKSSRNDDVSIISDEDSSDNINNAFISPRENEFSARTWWMVDVDHDDGDEEEGSTNHKQGATALVKRCMRVHGWSLEKTRRVLNAYRQFLALKKEREDWDATELSPSYLVDQMWHQHILDVVNYCHDMMLLCGRVVGHNPDGALNGKKERDETTRKALEERFKTYDKEIWGPSPGTVVARSGNDVMARSGNDAGSLLFTIKVKHVHTGEEIPFAITKSTSMSEVMNAYANLKRVPASSLYFFARCTRVEGSNTPRSLWLSNNHKIHVCNDENSFYNKVIGIRVKDQTGVTSRFLVTRLTRLTPIFKRFAARIGVEESAIRFLLNGEAFNPRSSPVDLDWDDDMDQFDAFVAQSGC